jgi:hypothetical protein
MKLFRKTTVIASFLIGLMCLSGNVNGQCKRFTKKWCLPSLSPYVHNGQLTTAILNPGDSADIDLTFNAGKEYKIVICSQDQIGKVQFKVLDQSRKVLHTSDPNEKNPSWRFKLAHTQQLIVQLTVPKMEKTNQRNHLVPNGCVSLLIGFMK